jgi:hypothetical protein
MLSESKADLTDTTDCLSLQCCENEQTLHGLSSGVAGKIHMSPDDGTLVMSGMCHRSGVPTGSTNS